MRNLSCTFHILSLSDTEGEIWIINDLNIIKPDTRDIIHIGKCFARLGCFVIIPHPVHYKSEAYLSIFGGLLGTKYEKKCPDLLINGLYYEYESFVRPWNKRKLSNMLSHGLKQSDRLIIDIRDGVSVRSVLRAIRSRLNVNAQISEVWVYDGKNVLEIYP